MIKRMKENPRNPYKGIRGTDKKKVFAEVILETGGVLPGGYILVLGFLTLQSLSFGGAVLNLYRQGNYVGIVTGIFRDFP
jgi:hypothetical protein